MTTTTEGSATSKEDAGLVSETFELNVVVLGMLAVHYAGSPGYTPMRSWASGAGNCRIRHDGVEYSGSYRTIGGKAGLILTIHPDVGRRRTVWFPKECLDTLRITLPVKDI